MSDVWPVVPGSSDSEKSASCCSVCAERGNLHDDVEKDIEVDEGTRKMMMGISLRSCLMTKKHMRMPPISIMKMVTCTTLQLYNYYLKITNIYVILP